MDPDCPKDTIFAPRLCLKAFPRPPGHEAKGPSVAWQRALAAFHAIRTDPATAQWSFEGKPDATPEVTEEWMRHQSVLTWSYLIELNLPHESSDAKSAPAEAVQSSNPIIGSVDLKLPSEKSEEYRSKEVEIAYFLDSAYRGNGYATEACGALVDAFWKHEHQQGDHGYMCLDGMTDRGNQPSRRVLEKLGFGVFKVFEKNHENKLLGGWRDLEQWRILKPVDGSSEPYTK